MSTTNKIPPSVIPLESNPDIFTKFAHSLGLSPEFAFHDIFSLTEPDLLAFLPRPMNAIILLFPINNFFDTAKDSDTLELPESVAPPVIWFKQTVRNACGLYALLHSLSNNRNLLTKHSILDKFLEANKRENGLYNDNATDDFIVSINELYNENSTQGQTEAPDASAEVDLHFITFIEHKGKIYELDGRRQDGSHVLGTSSSSSGDLLDEDLIKDRVSWYMNNADESIKLNFSLLGLAPAWD